MLYIRLTHCYLSFMCFCYLTYISLLSGQYFIYFTFIQNFLGHCFIWFQWTETFSKFVFEWTKITLEWTTSCLNSAGLSKAAAVHLMFAVVTRCNDEDMGQVRPTHTHTHTLAHACASLSYNVLLMCFRLQPRTEVLLSALVSEKVDNKTSLEAAWTENDKCKFCKD